ncbi:MAG: 1-acyl-sn-glycerol-3-phosphate acyltransferase, partial [Xanthomonadales bacterium]|nr:1-acyl-sn-glycerol-3-phosphate acyltransferase [Xanthomonadales bacterium]
MSLKFLALCFKNPNLVCWTASGQGATIKSMRSFLKKYLLIPWQLYVWLIYLPLIAVWTVIMATIVILTAVFISKEKASKYPSALWAKVCAWLTPALVSVNGREHLADAQAYVVVSNHQSQYDILLLYGWIGLSVKWIMKKEIRKIPAIGIAN